jgi:hypothetical protein
MVLEFFALKTLLSEKPLVAVNCEPFMQNFITAPCVLHGKKVKET